MTAIIVEFQQAECMHIALLFNERVLNAAPSQSEDNASFRLQFIRKAIDEDHSPLFVGLTKKELRTLDTLLTDSDPRSVKMPDGRLALELLKVIWKALTEGEPHAEDRNRDRDLNPHPNEEGRQAVG